MNRPLVELRGIGKAFPDSWRRAHRGAGLWRALLGLHDPAATRVLQDVDLAVRRGESVGLIGDNGAGKSTLLKVLTGVLHPTSGQVATRGRIGALLELGAGFHPDYTGRENIELSGALLGLFPSTVREMAPEIMAFADLGEQIDEPIKHYSSGMVVRLGFAILSVTRPDLLVTDEVLAVGDESFQRKCLQWIDGYIAGGGTLLAVSHSMDQIRRLCVRACWLREGRVELEGPADEVVDAYLAYHDELNARSRQSEFSAGLYRIVAMTIMPLGGDPVGDDQALTLDPGKGLAVEFLLHSPDDREPVLAFGIKDAHSAAVYGTTSEIEGAAPQRVAPGRYRFRLSFDELPLQPGRYRISGHAMDPEGLRLFDTVNREFCIDGKATGAGFLRV